MKYVSIDIETTGLDSDKHQVLQVAFVIEDSEKNTEIEDLPYLVLNIVYDEITGSLTAINMNKDLIESLINCTKDSSSESGHQMSKTYHIKRLSVFNQTINDFIKAYTGYYMVGTPITVAGKNVGVFDIPFLKKSGFDIVTYFNRRTIDPSVFFLNHDDTEVPNLTECLKRAGINKEVSHTALEDARDIIRVIRASRMFSKRQTGGISC